MLIRIHISVCDYSLNHRILPDLILTFHKTHSYSNSFITHFYISWAYAVAPNIESSQFLSSSFCESNNPSFRGCVVGLSNCTNFADYTGKFQRNSFFMFPSMAGTDMQFVKYLDYLLEHRGLASYQFWAKKKQKKYFSLICSILVVLPYLDMFTIEPDLTLCCFMSRPAALLTK